MNAVVRLVAGLAGAAGGGVFMYALLMSTRLDLALSGLGKLNALIILASFMAAIVGGAWAGSLWGRSLTKD